MRAGNYKITLTGVSTVSGDCHLAVQALVAAFASDKAIVDESTRAAVAEVTAE